jgi:hypothetical protein
MDDDVPGIPIVDKETVGEYTGLKDRNGREIYEGDVVDLRPRYSQPHRIEYSCGQWICVDAGGGWVTLIEDEQLGDEYHQALQRNALMEIVTEIYPILQPYGMKVSNWTHFECDWPPLKELAAFASNLISSEKTFPESFPKYRGS